MALGKEADRVLIDIPRLLFFGRTKRVFYCLAASGPLYIQAKDIVEGNPEMTRDSRAVRSAKASCRAAGKNSPF